MSHLKGVIDGNGSALQINRSAKFNSEPCLWKIPLTYTTKGFYAYRHRAGRGRIQNRRPQFLVGKYCTDHHPPALEYGRLIRQREVDLGAYNAVSQQWNPLLVV